MIHLIDRTFQVLIRDAMSEEVRVYSCDPQGSFIGPHLLLVMGNDLPDGIQHFCWFVYTQIDTVVTKVGEGAGVSNKHVP